MLPSLNKDSWCKTSAVGVTMDFCCSCCPWTPAAPPFLLEEEMSKVVLGSLLRLLLYTCCCSSCCNWKSDRISELSSKLTFGKFTRGCFLMVLIGGNGGSTTVS